MEGILTCRFFDSLGQECEPLLLEGNPAPGDDDTGGKSEGEGFLLLVKEGKIKEDGVRAVIVVSGEDDLVHIGKGDL